MNNTELKPCPFCGGKAELDYTAGGRPCILFAKVKCITCGNGTKIFPTEDKYGNPIEGTEYAEKSWNRRLKE